MIKNIHIKGRQAAFIAALKAVNGDCILDSKATQNAGYETYRKLGDFYTYICALGDRYEVNFSNNNTLNIWIDPIRVKVRKIQW